MLQINGLTKRYEKTLVLDQLTMSVKEGEIYGFVGANGAGKTTTMRIVAGLLEADSGKISIGGKECFNNIPYRKTKIGYMPDFFGVYDNLKVEEYMHFFASIYGIRGIEAEKRCKYLLDSVDLQEKAECYVDELSRGMKQRLCLARSLVHNPDFLILDEPASGLDPSARIQMTQILTNLSKEGKAILISSHILPELVTLCHRIGILSEGRILLSGTVNEIRERYMKKEMLMVKVIRNKEKAIQIIKENPLVEHLSILDDTISVTFRGGEYEEAALLNHLIEEHVTISFYGRKERDFEELFMKLTKNKRKEDKNEVESYL